MASRTTSANEAASVSHIIAAELPYLRRHARALTGNQTTGDRYAVATLEAILADPLIHNTEISPKVALFQTFHLIWSSAGAPVADNDTNSLERRAQVHLSGLTKDSREALLLSTIEGFDGHELGQVLQTTAEDARQLVQTAMPKWKSPYAVR